MKSRLINIVIVAIMFIGTLGFIRHADINNQKLRIQEVKIRDTNLQIKSLEEENKALEKQTEEAKGNKEKLDQIQKERDELQKKTQDLESQLQAKKAQKQTLALKNNTATVSAAPVSGSCADWMAQAGITDPDAVWLIGKESGCRPNAINPTSGACGIPQALPCSKLPCTLQDPVCQLRWMSQYVANRYGSWSSARAFHQSHNWY